MGAPAPEAATGESAASSSALKMTRRGSRLPLPRAEPDRPAAEADRLKASARPPPLPPGLPGGAPDRSGLLRANRVRRLRLASRRPPANAN
eukprot:6067219-Alexandrium_andersonii.AAC.1